MRIIPITVLMILLPTLAGAAGFQPGDGENDALVMVITKWDDDCSGKTRSSMDNMLNAWYDEITDSDSAPNGHGSRAWDEDGFYENGQRVDSEYTDDDAVSFGNDDANDNADEPDALFIAMHGGHFTNTNRWYGEVRVNESGDGNCEASQGSMILGDYDLEFLHIHACHSMCRSNWDTDVGDGDAEWRDTYDGLHQINGFHGTAYSALIYNSRYSGFADDGFDIALADAWVDNLYSVGTWTAGEQCPVSMAAGKGEGSVETRISETEYDWRFDDPDNPTWWAVIWVGDCDPSGEAALP